MATQGKNDYYGLLGVQRDASDKELKSAYRKLARKYHPDANAGDPAAEDRFKEISEAFAVLSDKEKRARYDQGGHDAFGAGFDPFAGFDVRTSGMGDLSDIFEMFMGGASGRSRGRSMPRRGQDLNHRMRLPFRQAILGATREIEIPRVRGCSQCGGRGESAGKRCGGCRGTGTQRESRRVKVRIPAGIADGGTLRIRGKGDTGSAGAPAGDLFLEIQVDPHPDLRREGRSILTDVTIGIGVATLGGTVTVPTLDGPTEVQVPAGFRSGQKLRLRGLGVAAGNGRPAGDLLARIEIQAPTSLDEESRKLLERFRELNPEG